MKRQAGQSTIEFIVTFTFGLGIIFLFVNVALNYSAGYLVHYATFMASRTYLTVEGHSPTDATSNNLAKDEALKTFARFKVSALGVPSTSVLSPGGSAPGFYINPFDPPPSPPGDVIYVGAYAVFEREPSLFKMVAGGDKVKFVSESFLGKEPTRIECLRRTCSAILLGIKNAADDCGLLNSFDFTVYDNGC